MKRYTKALVYQDFVAINDRFVKNRTRFGFPRKEVAIIVVHQSLISASCSAIKQV